ncbi:3-deoxy-manno-octulosonate cytidylyltransferase (CMP-KDO synthetase) [Palleronia marisminoris]|uniref:3-deoxy-manno-octulosonate cytidylyltransferase n=1 Tax=Palleronia marisminoris TaxID=315423 RepID=A0A1Y5TMG7_9RHOB|nr:manno-octulosonate cytidylyltransferase [Palleronia marisminoris]SFH44520.1 3-deoxy-manno-octulosonate cytidylyltransferase (CMP-KDO synthetase) [Palleronia marisminoris]SLN67531.1 3-deoxy-manno-octulosonate cytidylyltransferase [Palleronia marisminoris]
MKTAIVIPARYASTRYPGKPLAELTLPDGSRKSLIQLTWEAAQAVAGDHPVLVASDDDRIRTAAERFGAEVVMTPETCRNGTERCAAAVEAAGLDADVIVNLQGDAPLTPPWFIEALIDEMARGRARVATPVLRCDAVTYGHFVEDRKAGRVGGTTAVFGTDRSALYFSKEVIPWLDPAKIDPDNIPVFHHVGVYAYTRDALSAYGTLPEGTLERLEGLEQLRFLENGWPVTCVEVDARGRVFWELNNPGDVARIESVL